MVQIVRVSTMSALKGICCKFAKLGVVFSGLRKINFFIKMTSGLNYLIIFGKGLVLDSCASISLVMSVFESQ